MKDPRLRSSGIDHPEGMTENQEPERKSTEADVLSSVFHLKRRRPPGFVALYRHRTSDSDGELVAIFEMSVWQDALKMLERLIRGWKEDELYIVATTDPQEIILLEEGRPRALSVRQLRALYAEYDEHFERLQTPWDIRPFSPKYERLYEKFMGWSMNPEPRDGD